MEDDAKGDEEGGFLGAIHYDATKESPVTVFIINQYLAHYDSLGNIKQNMLEVVLKNLYLETQSLFTLGEITEEEQHEILGYIRNYDESLAIIGRGLTHILRKLKAAHHVEPRTKEASSDVMDSIPWDNLDPQ